MKKYSITLGILQAVTALGAIPAGIGYLSDTSGRAMGVTTAMLADSPLDTFLLPGLFLLIINGIITAAAAYLSFTGNRFAGHAGIVLGIILCLWILIQVAWITLSSFLQPMFFIVGLADILLSIVILRKKTAQSES